MSNYVAIREAEGKEREERLGLDAAKFIDAVTNGGFDAFKRTCVSLGYPSVGGKYIGECRSNEILDAMICARYPFLSNVRSRSGVDAGTVPDHRYCYINEFPTGWRAAFALELCEDIRTAALSIDEELLFDISVSQIKEKYGTLRFYYDFYSVYDADVDDDRVDSTCNGLMEIIDHIIDVYEAISSQVCISCGSTYHTYVTTGWISTMCPMCHIKRESGSSNYGEELESLLAEAGRRYMPFGMDAKEKIGEYLLGIDGRPARRRLSGSIAYELAVGYDDASVRVDSLASLAATGLDLKCLGIVESLDASLPDDKATGVSREEALLLLQ